MIADSNKLPMNRTDEYDRHGFRSRRRGHCPAACDDIAGKGGLVLYFALSRQEEILPPFSDFTGMVMLGQFFQIIPERGEERFDRFQ